MKGVVFLDRDGVVNKEKDYLYKLEDFEFIDDVFDILKFFQSKGYLIFIITNQSGINRGFYSIEDYTKLTDWMLKKFKQQGIIISKVYFCPHRPDEQLLLQQVLRQTVQGPGEDLLPPHGERARRGDQGALRHPQT